MNSFKTQIRRLLSLSLLLWIGLLLNPSKGFAVTEFVSTINKTGEDYNTLSAWEAAMDDAGDIRESSNQVVCGAWDTMTGTLIADTSTVTWDSGAYTGTLIHQTQDNGFGVDQYLIRCASSSDCDNLDDNDTVSDGVNTFTVDGAPDSCILTAHLYDDQGAIDDAVSIDGFTTSETNYIQITAAPGERHSGVFGTGVVIYPSTSQPTPISISESHVRISWLEINCKNCNNSGDFALKVANSRVGIVLENLLIQGDEGETGGIKFEPWGVQARISNVVMYKLGAGNRKGIELSAGGTTYMHNIIVFEGWKGIWVPSTGGSQYHYGDNIGCFASTSTCLDNFQTGYLNYSISSDSSADNYGGTGNQVDKTSYTDYFVNVGTDFHIKDTNSVLYNAGIDLSEDSNYPLSEDIDGEIRIGTWDVGVDEWIVQGTNQAPTVDAGDNQTLNSWEVLTLQGTVGDDFLPNPPASVVTTWSQESGPGTVMFANTSALTTTATFSVGGTYVLRLTADDDDLVSFDEVTVTVADLPPPNLDDPAVAGDGEVTLSWSSVPSFELDLGETLPLNATVTDDGLPNPSGTFSILWSKEDGPGNVTFADPNAATTTATFSLEGNYRLRLTADDGALVTQADITVLVNNPITNTAPTVNAGVDDTLAVTGTLTLSGTFSDDGLPDPPGSTTVTWSKTSGPGAVTFADVNSLTTTATFSVEGTYLIRLTADDGDLEAYDELEVNVFAPTPVSGTIDTDTTWDLDGSPYIVTGDITVSAGVTLTIDPGVEVLFDGFYALTVNGILNAQGTLENFIRFSSNASSPASGDWNYLRILSEASTLDYLIIEYADRGLYVPSGASNPVVLQNSVVRYNANGVYFEPATGPHILSNEITNNTVGIFAGCNGFTGCSPEIHQNEILDNTQYNLQTFSYSSNASSVTIDAENNWWGSATGIFIASTIDDNADDSQLAVVDYEPYLSAPVIRILNNSVSNRFFDPRWSEETSIEYNLEIASDVTVKIYDQDTDNLVRTLINNQARFAGSNTEDWDGKDDSAQTLSEGLYYYTIDASSTVGGGMEGRYDPEFSPGTVEVQNVETTPTTLFEPYKGDRLKITYGLLAPANVTLRIDDATVVINQPRETTGSSEYWNGRLDSGEIFTSTLLLPIRLYADALPENILGIQYHADSDLDISSLTTDPYVLRPLMNEITTIQYTLTDSADLTVQVLTPDAGTILATLESDITKNAGSYSIQWDGRTDNGKVVADPGDYRVRVKAVDSLDNTVQRDGNIRIFF